MIKMILAVDAMGGIGMDDGTIPWDIPEDRIHFRQCTRNHRVIMGRKTFDSLHMPDGLSDRENYVLTSHKDIESENVTCISHPEMLGLLSRLVSNSADDTWVIGGGYMYEEFIDYADEVWMTIVPYSCGCDVSLTDVFDLKLRQQYIITKIRHLAKVPNNLTGTDDNIECFVWRRRKEFEFSK